MGCAAAERRGSRIEHAVMLRDKLSIALLLRRVGVMAHVKIPLHRVVLRRQRVKGGNLVLFRQVISPRLHRVAARLEEQYRTTCLREIRRHGAATSPRADNDIFTISLFRAVRAHASAPSFFL